MSNPLERYDFNSEWGYGTAEYHADGDWVRYSDVLAMQERIALLEAVAEAAGREEMYIADENQYATQQARVDKLHALGAAGYKVGK